MEGKGKKNDSNQSDFSEVIKKAYEKGINENEITVSELINVLKAELKNILIS
ncbi:hypothetical protein NDK43_30320 [Neobacillus pocheonensis]|uniref:Uncharacterized protein n=1 Tax=Neobacillus pocheonensis TaxID=363869 RepID=A0ABT0WHL0_9BACI|nr:hypothetical protein [Neobacillus pocheonensis]